MKERAFDAKPHEVLAILAGTQTQTRRVLKEAVWHSLEGTSRVRLVDEDHKGNDLKNDFDNGHISCAYGQAGDRLWVREAWADLSETHGQPWERRNPETGLYERGRSRFPWYRADGQQPEIGDGRTPVAPWLRSTCMPRWASRIDLEVTGVRVERLNDISEADAMAEGVEAVHGGWHVGAAHASALSAQHSFQRLWESINGADRWAANPWVWCVEFKRVKP
jgi:hypothetical protein